MAHTPIAIGKVISTDRMPTIAGTTEARPRPTPAQKLAPLARSSVG